MSKKEDGEMVVIRDHKSFLNTHKFEIKNTIVKINKATDNFNTGFDKTTENEWLVIYISCRKKIDLKLEVKKKIKYAKECKRHLSRCEEVYST
jgi:hypothetical protein